MNRLILRIFVFASAFWFFVPVSSWADFRLSVVPYEGGNDIRFERARSVLPYTTEEVVVSITSTITKQYQVIQSLLEPLTSIQGQSLSRENFTVYAIPGSNASGTLTVQQETAVSPGRTILYVSNSLGASDTFRLAYVLKPPFNVPSGSYRGRISFTLEAIDAAELPVTVILNISAEIQAESSFEIRTLTGASSIRLDSSRPDAQTCDVLFSIKGSRGNQFRILQSLSGFIESIEGNRLPPDAIYFRVSQAEKGMGPNQNTPLSETQEAVYLSGPTGAEDQFIITYSLADTDKQKAGRYRGQIRYMLEALGLQELIGKLDLEVEVARIFDLKITPELGGRIEFRDLKPQVAPKQSEVIFEVASNIGRPYQITQFLSSGLVNKEGSIVPQKYFTLREESLGTRGRLTLSSPTEVKTGETILFVSDTTGSSDKFKIIYELKPSFDIMAGDYSTRITYSISEI
ncbi:MAG: hypothetical protein AMJ95_01605 [Omnitrophica WOR_2 bacterium SM23_72]|nr:MAG: hypothetical protein AMJ95_01605 [Omnitrophica WOR_2 bacterium SM23_72]